ncbi:hypothetical protein AN6022.2 [Aspergillus nidulans FGSC A4]|uniref:Aldehyde dehydrogenase domain-containing protein n=1 Tax=Emericella nidulans (strain FGSC A4 / ATCC 38163 / CBS 112.46 / NRRL 194 / M139) TaxID=227321 RepID=Q5B0A8_EMENI|nr:hypothetical protein [Aspergillus nidulans FGSC A4]EAA57663.1 hypothetical protein AN6022.2 [Aspergillus nidulans FGSC A4]CBF70342.1 TPA: conserved hypothetical protein [Aspergillus nidulans FGSC A4]|eukprot:XP_663626.1 hypothetical protein AN6022.2 [Aspergillus nidulans FGSC A4]
MGEGVMCAGAKDLRDRLHTPFNYRDRGRNQQRCNCGSREVCPERAPVRAELVISRCATRMIASDALWGNMLGGAPDAAEDKAPFSFQIELPTSILKHIYAISNRLLTSRLSSADLRLPRPQIRTKATAPSRLPDARNEPNPTYVKGSSERLKIESALSKLRSQLPVQSSIYYNGKVQAAWRSWDQPLPAEHAAIESALKAKKDWENTPFIDRAAIFLKAAELVTGKYRYELIAATMLGQGKNIWQAEIDAAAELADFFRLNCNFAAELLERQPTRGTVGMWSRMEYRPLEGFVYAVSPFNLTALGGSLLSGPALMGNVVLWKPSPPNVYTSTLIYKILLEAGLPADVVQFVPGARKKSPTSRYKREELPPHPPHGRHSQRRQPHHPRCIRVPGTKVLGDLARIHPSVPRGRIHLAPQGRVQEITIGSPDKELEAFMGPVIHRRSFDQIKRIIDESNDDPSLNSITGGTYDDSVGFYVHPTVYQANAPTHRLFDEIFGPIPALYVYLDNEWSEILAKVDQAGGGFALTGPVFATDRRVIWEAEDALGYSAGNFYINCKTTAALIGQQLFGGARASGTNDKAGSSDILRRFPSLRMIKEFFLLEGFKYPSNQ